MAEFNATQASSNELSVRKGKLTKKQKQKIKHNRYSKNKNQSARNVEPVRALVTYGGGICEIETTGDVYGIEMHYRGNLHITSKHAKLYDLNRGIGGWVMAANNSTGKLIYLNYDGEPINASQELFRYKGNVSFHNIIVAGSETQIRGELKTFETDHFSSLNTTFNKLDRKFKVINYTNKARLTPKGFTGYEVPKPKLIGKDMKTKNTIRRTTISGGGATGSSGGGSGGGGY